MLVRKHALEAVRATIAITVFAFMTYVPVYALLVATGAVASRLDSAPIGEILFQMVFQGVGSVVISGITFTRMIQYFGPVRSTMITALVPGLSAFGAVIFLGEPLLLEPDRRAAAGDRRHPVRRAAQPRGEPDASGPGARGRGADA